MSEGPYGRHGYTANPGYSSGASYGGGGGGYAAPSYGQSYGGVSYAAPSPQDSGYGAQYGSYGVGAESYQVCENVVCLLAVVHAMVDVVR